MARRGLRLSDVGEFGLIARIERLASAAGATRGPAVVLGPGDDAAVLRMRRDEDAVLTTDAFVEDVHYRLDQETPRTAGGRALVANLSDLAAMGARPLGFTWALAAPPSLALRTALGLARGLVAVAARHRCPLVGGNVARAGEVSLTVAALGAVTRGRALRRDGARPGDRILLTGPVGRSALERARGRVRTLPEPRLGAGRALARARWATACIDVSDGLLADLGHLCRASGVGASVDARRVPRPRGFAAGCRRAGLEPDRLALGGGEDYELVVTVAPGAPSRAALARRLGTPVAEIGRIERAGLRVEGASAAVAREAAGWRHF